LVIVDGVVLLEIRVCTLLGLLLGDVQATSVYDGNTLGGSCMLFNWVLICFVIFVICALSVSICWVKVLVRTLILFACFFICSYLAEFCFLLPSEATSPGR